MTNLRSEGTFRKSASKKENKINAFPINPKSP
jgi:hypothetical protein